MKHFAIVWIIIILVGLYGLWILHTNEALQTTIGNPAPTPSLTPQPDQTVATTSLFVPYWSLSTEQSLPTNYDTYLYFGIQATRQGLNTLEDGYTRLPLFLSTVPANKTTLLVVRMIDNTDNAAILGDTSAQKKIIAQTTALASQKGFNGIVLDLEMSAIPFSSLIEQINSFNDAFSQSAKTNNLSYSITTYGDSFYRPRPFDLKHLSTDADTIYIMSYDLHKASGNPGPNFPITEASEADYDLADMLTDYEAVIPKSKIAIVFGLFGYDWPVDAKGNAMGTGTALSYDEIAQKFINACSEKNCVVKTDQTSGENVVTYTDAKNQKHIIWFDSPDSVKRKETFLQGKGIQDFSFWAWSYF